MTTHLPPQHRTAATATTRTPRRSRKQINASPTEAEYRCVTSAATKAGLTPARYLLVSALAYQDQRFVVPEDLRRELRNLIRETRAVGRSLNQIARVLNTFQKKKFWIGKLPADVENLEPLVYQLEEKVRVFIERPPRKEVDS